MTLGFVKKMCRIYFFNADNIIKNVYAKLTHHNEHIVREDTGVILIDFKELRQGLLDCNR